MVLSRKVPHADRAAQLAVNPMYAGIADVPIPRFDLPDGELPPGLAAQIVYDELMLDGNARLNLATFVSTWMEPEARVLLAETLDKNMVDRDEYPQTAELERRCVNIIAHLWNAPEEGDAIGTSTTGSSEAAMLGGLALKHRWRARRRAAGQPDDRPNLVMGANVQVCWEKFCRYFDVEPRLVPVARGRHHLTAHEAVRHCDERTIGVVGILGSTFDGSYEPIAEMATALDRLAADGGPDVPIHVDGASGGFVAPFLDPDTHWDFRVERVASINASGHKFGLVYPGVGWVVWRDAAALPDDLVFSVSYLGGAQSTFALTFSRPGAPIIAQYYNFLRLGRDGYRRVQQATRDVARRLADGIGELDQFTPLTRAEHIPVFAFRLADGITNYTVYDVSRALRSRGWLVPAYPFPPDLEDLHVLRIVVRNGFSSDLGGLLLEHLRDAVAECERQPAPLSIPDASFHH
ncbi:MAG TPA: glutamate decarboxylase [Acidimicrobiia bacterium]|jgi:glutamate decarboxylase